LKERLDKHRSIAKHIIEGTLTIDSVSELESMLKLFPDAPALHAAFADLLAKKNRTEDAALSYGHAAALYLKAGKMLSAILAQIMHWRLQKPSHGDARQFFTLVRSAQTPDSPAKRFFHGLSYSEFIALTNRMARVRLLSDKVIKKIGDEENELYFIASGAVRQTVYEPLETSEDEQRKQSFYLAENDVFGEVYPFEEQKLAQSFTQTVSSVELARISKSRLTEVCRKYPNVERAIILMFDAIAKTKAAEAVRGARSAGRQSLPIRVSLEIMPGGSSDAPIVLEGYSRDISVGGICVVVDAKYASIASSLKTLADAAIEVCFPSSAMKLNVAGRIVWNKEVASEGEKTLALGVQFKDLTPKMSGMLIVFADMLYSDQ
jgi:CRP-like cAMP-binding protein/Tfp pilus assembly protein PilZ